MVRTIACLLTEGDMILMIMVSRPNLTVCYSNIRSLTANFKDLCCFVGTWHYDIMCSSETWLDASASSDDISIPGYQTSFRRDRNRHGGGVLVNIKNYINCARQIKFETNGLEILWLDILLSSNEPAYLAICYQPPTLCSNEKKNFNEAILNSLDEIVSLNPFAIILTGDFNNNSPCTSVNQLSKLYLRFYQSHYRTYSG